MRPGVKWIGVVLLLAGCASRGGDRNAEIPPLEATGPELDGTAWVLTDIDGRPPVAGSEVTLAFVDPGRVAGNAGINRYFGPVTWEGDAGIGFGMLGMTRMAGPGPIMHQEQTFVTLLGQVDGYRVDDGRLELLIAARTVLGFAPVEE